MFRQWFTIGETCIQFVTNEMAISRRIGEWLGPFASSGTQDSMKVCLFSVSDSLPIIIPENTQHIASGYMSEHFSHRGLWLIDVQGRARWVADTQRKLLLGFVQYHYFQGKPWLLETLTHPIFELLRRRELYLIHSGGVSFGEKGVLIAGESRSGKTTLVLQLVREGFRFMSDDRCFLRSVGSEFEILSFPEPVRVYSPNVADIPELQFLQDDEHEENAKRSFNIEEVYPNCMVKKAKLKAIVFPLWDSGDESQLEAMSASEALREMLCLTLEVLFAETARAHFTFIGDVVERVPCFRLYLSRDKREWHHILKELLQ
jgi:hypothetical protein